jgi:hypothetical protein
MGTSSFARTAARWFHRQIAQLAARGKEATAGPESARAAGGSLALRYRAELE